MISLATSVKATDKIQPSALSCADVDTYQVRT